MKKPRNREMDGPTFQLGQGMEVRNPAEPSIEYADFNEAHVYGARLILMKMLMESRQDWTSAGFRHWAENQIISLQDVEDNITRG